MEATAANAEEIQPDGDDSAKKADEFIEAVASPVPHREQTIIFRDFERTYVQKPLSFFAKFEFVRLVGKAIDEATSGANPLTLSQLVSGGAPSDLSSADTFIRAMARLAEFAPDLLKDVYMIALDVPRHERALLSEILDMSYDEETGEGGLSDEDGLAILETFVDQNAKVLADFFRVKMTGIIKRAREAVNVQMQESSKRLKRTPANTPKR